MKLRVGDKVRVMVGKDKGKEGKITHTFKNENKVVVEGINIVKKHLKPNGANQNGGIVEVEAKIHASNVMLIDPKTNKVTRKKAVSAKKTATKKVAKKEETKEKEAKVRKTKSNKEEA